MGADPNEPVPKEALREELNKHSKPETAEHRQCMAAFSTPGGYLAVCNRRLAGILGDDKWLWL